MKSGNVIAIERVLKIFETFQSNLQPLSFTHLAEETEIPKSTCHAIVNTLIDRGFLYSLHRPRTLYPTRRMFDMMQDICDKDPFIERFTPTLEKLRDTCGETIILGKRQNNAVIYLQVYESLNSIRYSAKPGDLKPLHSSAIGKTILGSLKETELITWLQDRPLPKSTFNTKTADELLCDLRESRKRGYYVTKGENVADVWAVASSVKAFDDTLVVAIAGPQHRMEGSLEEIARLLITNCSYLMRQMGRKVSSS